VRLLVVVLLFCCQVLTCSIFLILIATVYDVTRRDTFTNLSEIWAKEIDLYSTNQDCIKMLVGNKVDKVIWWRFTTYLERYSESLSLILLLKWIVLYLVYFSSLPLSMLHIINGYIFNCLFLFMGLIQVTLLWGVEKADSVYFLKNLFVIVSCFKISLNSSEDNTFRKFQD
jgi:hypothetical protein